MMNDSDDEIVAEDEAEGSPGAIKRLRERLNKAIEEKQEYLEGWQRSRADFANFKRDEEMRREHSVERLKASLAEEIIPTLDSFEMAFRSPSFEKGDKEWKNGIVGLYKGLISGFERFGVKQYNPLGEKFDPKEHEPLREVEVGEEDKDHTVVSVERSGYKLKDFVIRPAQVSIGIFKKH
jgi:molecular chaperone GrpE